MAEECEGSQGNGTWSLRAATGRIMVMAAMALAMLAGLGTDVRAQTAVEPIVVQWLDAIEKRADQTKTFRSIVSFKQIQGLLGDEQTRFGTLYYINGQPARFAVHFTALVVDDKRQDQNRAWIFDGQWLVERLDDRRQFIKRQVIPPHQAGERNLLSITESPFPIPLRPRRNETLSRFDVTILPPAEGDPKDSVHFHLKPRPNLGIAFSRVDLWYDQHTLLPLRAHTWREDTGDEQIFNLFRPAVNIEIDPKVLDTTSPTDRDWHVEVIPFAGEGA